MTIKIAELDERVCSSSLVVGFSIELFFIIQAKERDIYDTGPFLHSRLFESNGYKLNDAGDIEKRFRNNG